MRFIKHFNREEKLNEVERIKKYIELGILLITVMQIFQEFFYNIYINYALILITMAEAGVFIYGFFVMLETMSPRYGISEKRMEVFSNFHNSFFTSMLIPLVFLFDASNTDFTLTRIPNVDILKRVSILIMIATMGLYRILPSITRKYERMFEDTCEEDKEEIVRKYASRLSVCFSAVFMVDVFVMAVMSLFMFGMLYKDESISTFIIGTAALVAMLIVFKKRFVGKMKIITAVLMALTIFFAAGSVYDIYLKKSESIYIVADGSYHESIKFLSGGQTDLYCKLEKNQMKYCVTYTDNEGNESFKGVYECEYNASRPSKGISRWYDIGGNIYIERNKFQKGEQPVFFEVLKENLEMSKESSYRKYVDNYDYMVIGKNGNERELIVFGDGYIEMRGATLKKVDNLLDELFVIQ